MELIQRIFIILHVKVALWVWSDVQVEQLAVAACVWLQLQNMEDELRGTTANSNERSLRSGRAGMVKVGEFSIQIPLLQTTGRDKPHCRETICNVIDVQMKAFLEKLLTYLRLRTQSANILSHGQYTRSTKRQYIGGGELMR